MPKHIEESLQKMIRDFLWDGKKSRVSSEAMSASTDTGGKQILDIVARNEAIDLWNLQSYLVQDASRASWCFFVDSLLTNWLESSYIKIPKGQVQNIFIQNIHLPISSRTPLPEQIRRMITTAQKYDLTFTGLRVSQAVKLKMPMWRHPGVNKTAYETACRRRSSACLRLKHGIQTVEQTLMLASRRTVVANRPHSINPSGIARQNCACPSCRRDRNELGCTNPGICIETAKMLMNCICPKWNPTTPSGTTSALHENEITLNKTPIEIDEPKAFDPDITLWNLQDGFRIFAFEEYRPNLEAQRLTFDENTIHEPTT
ncbi:hypothetical protein R3P38DRAFT_2490321, partial [Favolaschia claudopus]